jgi:hypothetical protein
MQINPQSSLPTSAAHERRPGENCTRHAELPFPGRAHCACHVTLTFPRGLTSAAPVKPPGALRTSAAIDIQPGALRTFHAKLNTVSALIVLHHLYCHESTRVSSHTVGCTVKGLLPSTVLGVNPCPRLQQSPNSSALQAPVCRRTRMDARPRVFTLHLCKG